MKQFFIFSKMYSTIENLFWNKKPKKEKKTHIYNILRNFVFVYVLTSQNISLNQKKYILFHLVQWRVEGGIDARCFFVHKTNQIEIILNTT